MKVSGPQRVVDVFLHCMCSGLQGVKVTLLRSRSWEKTYGTVKRPMSGQRGGLVKHLSEVVVFRRTPIR